MSLNGGKWTTDTCVGPLPGREGQRPYSSLHSSPSRSTTFLSENGNTKASGCQWGRLLYVLGKLSRLIKTQGGSQLMTSIPGTKVDLEIMILSGNYIILIFCYSLEGCP